MIDLLLKQEIDNLFKAEFLRETGRFDDAIALIDQYTTEDINLVGFKEKIKNAALSSDPLPFIIVGEEYVDKD